MIIAFEGIDGSGKTTIVKKLFEYLDLLRPGNVIIVSEPSKTELGRKIKEAVLSGKFGLNLFEETLLFSADRNFYLRNIVLPSIENGKIVIMDRTFVSTYTYQIMNVYLDIELRKLLEKVIEQTIQNFVIDLLFYLDCSAEIAIHRISSTDNFESKGRNFLETVRKNYLTFLKSSNLHIKKIVSIESSKVSLDDIFNKVKETVLYTLDIAGIA